MDMADTKLLWYKALSFPQGQHQDILLPSQVGRNLRAVTHNIHKYRVSAH